MLALPTIGVESFIGCPSDYTIRSTQYRTAAARILLATIEIPLKLNTTICQQAGSIEDETNMSEKSKAKQRRDTQLESVAAEFLVLGRLLLERVQAYKAYVNYPGYDVVAVHPEKNKSARIQVKSRYRTDWDGFIINNFECDFVVLATLNRGYDRVKRNGETGVRAPEFYVLPIAYVKRTSDPANKWGKITRNRLVGVDRYKEGWELIREFLEKRGRTT